MTPTLSPLDTVNLFADPTALMENLQAHFYLATDYDYFINAIDTNIKRAFRYMESNPKLLQLSEDEITDSLRVALNMAGIPAEHDTMEGGHVDICIKSLRFKWLAEAKIKDDSYDYRWLWNGFMQLTERYATNTYECNKSGFLIYIKQPQSARVMARWKDHMSDQEGYSFSFEQISPVEFRSTHSHTRFGSDCLVTHYCLSIYFKPVV